MARCAGMTPGRSRFAIYFAPAANTALHAVGSRWLGRDAVHDHALAQPRVGGLTPERFAALTRAPRNYGLHATLKAPFALAPGRSYDDLLASAAALSAAQAPFALRPVIGQPDGFFALIEERPDGRVDELAAVMVRELDGFRAPPGRRELARRRDDGLSAGQDAMLQRWGYPYVMDEFRFHMTLTQTIDDRLEARHLRVALQRHFAAIVGRDQAIDAIAVFRQEGPGLPFRQVARLPFGKTG